MIARLAYLPYCSQMTKPSTKPPLCTLEAGSTYINRYASSDIRMPFGGTKRSGFGREMAREGMLAFTNLKTVIVAN